jgi:hypothetical protein
VKAFDEVAAASLPADALPLLAGLRGERALRVAMDCGALWLRFEVGNERVVRMIVPLHGARLFNCSDGVWRRFGESLPAFDFPQHLHFQPLYQVVFPAAVSTVPPDGTPMLPARLTLQPCMEARPTTAMICRLAALARWADTMPALRLERMRGVVRDGLILVVGDELPLVDTAERFWGRLVLVPLGWCSDPPLPEDALREAAGVPADELLVLRSDRAEAVPLAALTPLSRAALRLAVEGRP